MGKIKDWEKRGRLIQDYLLENVYTNGTSKKRRVVFQ